jgi:uncharacterized damage-inducible protein DinB
MSALSPENFTLALRKTPVILNSILRDVTQIQAQQMTDGSDGWSVIETMCHIRDFGDVLAQRIHLVLNADLPDLPAMQPSTENRHRDYHQQQLSEEFAAFVEQRKHVIHALSVLAPEQWQRRGIHAVNGEMTLLEIIIHAVWHDVNHIEQIVRSLELSDSLI